MANFSPLLEAEALDARILDAVAIVTGEDDIYVFDTYRGCGRSTGEVVENELIPDPLPPVMVEWMRRKGRFGLDLEIWGSGVTDEVSRADLSRAFARALGAPILVSDCSHFGFSWFKHDVDGAIWEVVSNTNDIDDFDLLSDLDPAHPDYYPALLILPAGAPLPPAAEPDAQRQRACEGEAPGSTRLCHHFGTPFCPKQRSIKPR